MSQGRDVTACPHRTRARGAASLPAPNSPPDPARSPLPLDNYWELLELLSQEGGPERAAPGVPSSSSSSSPSSHIAALQTRQGPRTSREYFPLGGVTLRPPGWPRPHRDSAPRPGVSRGAPGCSGMLRCPTGAGERTGESRESSRRGVPGRGYLLIPRSPSAPGHRFLPRLAGSEEGSARPWG